MSCHGQILFLLFKFCPSVVWWGFASKKRKNYTNSFWVLIFDAKTKKDISITKQNVLHNSRSYDTFTSWISILRPLSSDIIIILSLLNATMPHLKISKYCHHRNTSAGTSSEIWIYSAALPAVWKENFFCNELFSCVELGIDQYHVNSTHILRAIIRFLAHLSYELEGAFLVTCCQIFCLSVCL